jgi:hypothetical protein
MAALGTIFHVNAGGLVFHGGLAPGGLGQVVLAIGEFVLLAVVLAVRGGLGLFQLAFSGADMPQRAKKSFS